MITDDTAITKKTLVELKANLIYKRNSLGYTVTKSLMDNNGIVNMDAQKVLDTIKMIDTKITAIETILGIEEFNT